MIGIVLGIIMHVWYFLINYPLEIIGVFFLICIAFNLLNNICVLLFSNIKITDEEVRKFYE